MIHDYALTIDISTISIVAVSVASLLGLFLIIAWLQERDTRALAWWGAAYLIGASSMAVWTTPAPYLPIPPSLSGVLIFVSGGMVWNGVRLFKGRPVLQSVNFGGALVWLVGLQFPAMAGDTDKAATLGAVIVALYTFFIAFELRRERQQSLFSRVAAIAVPLMHAAMFMMPIALKDRVLYGAQDGWLVVFALEIMLYAVGIAFIALLMVKDHHVTVHRNAASTDPLTGLLNRRAFSEAVEPVYLQATKARLPVALLMFDLDRFKSINDTYGHAMGDDVLRLFAATTRANMRATDVIARLGGEEIAALVPAGGDLAMKIAERVRAGFEQAGVEVNGEKLNSTVSVGIAIDLDLTEGIDAVIQRADAALYRAKHDGRNRICLAEARPAPATASEKTEGTPDLVPVLPVAMPA